MRISRENQAAVVGGGSRGIGAAIVKMFAEARCTLVFSYRQAVGAAQKVVNAVAPGWVETDMAKPVLRKPSERSKATNAIPLRKFARPEEVAMPILFRASDMSTYMTGEIVNINGGSILCG